MHGHVKDFVKNPDVMIMAILIPGFNICYVFRHQLVTKFTGKNFRKDLGKKVHETTA